MFKMIGKLEVKTGFKLINQLFNHICTVYVMQEPRRAFFFFIVSNTGLAVNLMTPNATNIP